MRNPGATLLLVVTLLVGAMVAAGIGHQRAMAADRGISSSFVMDLADEAVPPMFPGDPPSDQIGPAPLADVAPLEEAGYFDTGPVEEDLASTTTEPAPTRDDLSQSDRATGDGSPGDTSLAADAPDSYRFEYPDEPYGDAAQPADEADYGQEDTDDEYDNPEYEYGYDFDEQYQGEYGYDYEDDYEVEDEVEYAYDYEDEYELEDDVEYEYDYEDEFMEDDFETVDDVEQRAWDDRGYDDGSYDDAFSYEDAFGYEDEPDYNPTPSEYEDGAYEHEAALDGQLEDEPGEGLEPDGQESYGYDGTDAEYYEYEFYGDDIQPVTVPDDNREADGSQSAEADGGATWQPEWQEMPQSGLELFARHPAELLAAEDQQMLQTLAALWEEPPVVRRGAFHNHLEGLGVEAIDFATRFEEVTGIKVLGLANDLPGAAAFLAAFRLADQGDLGMNEAIDLSERSLKRISWSWIEGVEEITAARFEDRYGPHDESEVGAPDWSDATSIDNPVVEVMVSLASRSVAGVSGAVRGVARRLAELDWPSLSLAPAEGQAASHFDPRDDSIQR